MVTLDTLSGMVRTAGGGPLENVTVRVASVEGVTDASGAFVLSSLGSLPVGMVDVELDGSTATATGPLPFPVLHVLVPLPAGTTALTMPQVITLPDLNNAMSANQSLTLNGDGTAAEPISVVQAGGMTDLSLSGPMGTLVTIGGMVGGAGVDLNVTPVVASEVPMPLPEGLLGNDFVTIQPGNAAFDAPNPLQLGGPVLGLDIVMPDSLGLEPGTMVDIWSFDHDSAEWVNRTEETGQSGMVQLIGAGPETEIVATGVITEGGWHTGVVPIDPDCATRISGSVINQATGMGIAGASIAFSSGQFATTGSDGTFLSDQLPAYDVAALAAGDGCFAEDICYEVVLPPCAGGLSSGKLVLGAADVVTGGTTPLDPVVFSLGSTGTVAGVVLGMGAPGAMVTFTPALGAPASVTPTANGSFFRTGLEAGEWTASFLFSGAAMPTTVPFTIVANTITTIAIQMGKGGGSDSVTVLVVETSGFNTTIGVPCPDATVRLQGTDGVSSGGLVMITGADGRATFDDVTGPFSVTAQKDIFDQGETIRHASSLVGIDPASGTIGVLLAIERALGATVVDPTLSGVVSGLPVPQLGQSYSISVVESGTGGVGFNGVTFPDPITGAYSILIPADTPVDIFLVHRNDLAPSRMVASLMNTNAGQAASGGTLTVDMDYANAVLWNRPVAFSFNNLGAGKNVFVNVQIENDATMSAFLAPLHFSSMGAQNLALNLPDVTDPKFAGYDISVSAVSASMSGDLGLACQLMLAGNPTNLDFHFRNASTLTNPMDGASFSVADLDALQVAYTPGAPGPVGSNSGPDIFGLQYESGGTGTPPPGIDGAEWSVFVMSDLGAFTLPLAGLPMFGMGQDEIFVELDAIRFTGVSFDYNSFFNENLAMNFANLSMAFTSQCQSFSARTISTQ